MLVMILKNVVPSNFARMVRDVLFVVMCQVWACELGSKRNYKISFVFFLFYIGNN